MSYSSFRLAIAVIGALLSISITTSASAASYKKCFMGWTFAYDTIQHLAEIKAKKAWNTKAQNTLATHNATWAQTTNRQRHITKVFLKGQPTHKVSVYGKFCKYYLPNTEPTPVGIAG